MGVSPVFCCLPPVQQSASLAMARCRLLVSQQVVVAKGHILHRSILGFFQSPGLFDWRLLWLDIHLMCQVK